MTTATKVTIPVGDFQLEAYQIKVESELKLLFTHRQIGEIIGKTKAAAGSFLRKHAEELPPPVKEPLASAAAIDGVAAKPNMPRR